MSYSAKTNWKLDEIVTEGDLNRIEQGVKEAHEGVQASLPNTDGSVTDANIGSRTITDSEAPTGDEGTPTELWNWQAYMTKAITGETNWRTAPDLTLKDVQTRLEAATNVATAGTLVERDGAGRFKAAAPAAADDVARKAEVDAASAAAGAAQAAANNAQTRANAGLPKDGSEAMTGPLVVHGAKGITSGSWGTISSAANGNYLLGHNCYIDINTGDFKYKNTHANFGARGIYFTWNGAANTVQPFYFDMGNVPSTADTVFTPTLNKIWHAGNDGAGSGLDADLLDGKQATDFAPSGFGLGTASQSISGKDLNHIRETGWYHGNEVVNAPGAGWHWFEVIRHEASDNVLQQAWSYFSSDQYVRRLQEGVWGPWVQVWNAGNNAALDKNTGGIVSGRLTTVKNTNAAKDGAFYVSSGMEVATADGSSPAFSFHRMGFYAKAIYLDADGKLKTVDSNGTLGNLIESSSPSLQIRDNNGVLEFYSGGVWKPVGGVKSVQRGIINTSNGYTYTDVSIKAVNVDKASVNPLSFGSAFNWELIGSTVLRIYHGAAVSSTTLRWEIIEYY
ncbi:pyocin knob domain-containing protein [Paenibacillus sp. y28]|uniref:pyocin knob domain-containing protein n=1 Tax=Paenibacillus sp. y28 TaxID=3129110 RepID=UPI003018BD47